MEQKAVGIRELARRLDISIGTVSRALNGRAEVSAETRARVHDAARQLGYAPNQSGRALRQGATRTVALMMRPGRNTLAYGETFFLTLSEGLQEVLAGAGLDLIVLPSGPGLDQFEYLRRAAERRLADAFIISDTQPTDPRIDHLLAKGIPFVALGRSLSGGAHPWIDLDFEGVAEQAVDRLFRGGHRRIALALTEQTAHSRIVLNEGFSAALQRRGLEPDPSLVFRVPDNEAGGFELGQGLLSQADRPTAVILAQATQAIGLYRFLRESNLRPGHDLSVIAFRHSPICQFLTPTLTSFGVSLQELGARLGRILIGAMQHGQTGQLVHELWPMTLIEGGSDGPI